MCTVLCSDRTLFLSSSPPQSIVLKKRARALHKSKQLLLKQSPQPPSSKAPGPPPPHVTKSPHVEGGAYEPGPLPRSQKPKRRPLGPVPQPPTSSSNATEPEIITMNDPDIQMPDKSPPSQAKSKENQENEGDDGEEEEMSSSEPEESMSSAHILYLFSDALPKITMWLAAIDLVHHDYNDMDQYLRLNYPNTPAHGRYSTVDLREYFTNKCFSFFMNACDLMIDIGLLEYTGFSEVC